METWKLFRDGLVLFSSELSYLLVILKKIFKQKNLSKISDPSIWKETSPRKIHDAYYYKVCF
ncbi:MAG TPA: hypothetical protein DCX32_03375 [Candidatus Moranbacteria bacterium]|nr:hypothetical protein [Candidatus Moranbacteria bacterium]